MIKEAFDTIRALDEDLARLRAQASGTSLDALRIRQLADNKRQLLTDAYKALTPADRVWLARHPARPNVAEIISALFTDFFELHGDRGYRDDPSIIGGVARFNGIPVTVIGTKKGHDLAENMEANFGMPNPEGYRKTLRLMKQAEKFHRPVITLIDTPGAYPGMEAEMHGQGEAIAKNLMEMARLTVPIIAVVIGEGGSGGALALSVADRIIMLENAVYSILSPEGFASILWKDASRAAEACELMQLTARDLFTAGICDKLIREDHDYVTGAPQSVYRELYLTINEMLPALTKLSPTALTAARYRKFRGIGDPDRPIAADTTNERK